MNEFIREGEYVVRRMEDTTHDYELVARWLTDERVLLFYEGRDNPFPVQRVREKYAPRVLSADGVTPCILEYEGCPVGYLQFYLADTAEYDFEGSGKIYAMDLFIGEPDCWGRGHGTRFLSLMLCYLFEGQSADWVLLDPHVENARAIRSYEKCGFRKLKILPQHEQHEGRLVDCWLMGIRWDQQASE